MMTLWKVYTFIYIPVYAEAWKHKIYNYSSLCYAVLVIQLVFSNHPSITHICC